MQGAHSKLQIGTPPSRFPGESESSCSVPWWDEVILFLTLLLLYHFLIHGCFVDSWGAVCNSRILDCEELLCHGRADQWPLHSGLQIELRPGSEGPSSHKGGGWNCLAVTINLHACLPPADRGRLIFGQSFISLISMTIKWIYVLVTLGSVPCRHPGRSCSKP